MCSKTWGRRGENRVHTSPQRLLQTWVVPPPQEPTPVLSPRDPCRPSSATPSAQRVPAAASPHTPTSPRAALPQPVPGGCSRGAAGVPPRLPPTAPRHSLVAQDDPLNTCPKEDNGADICQVVKESQEDVESRSPTPWDHQPSPARHPSGSAPHSKPTCPQPHSPGSGEP